MSDDITEAIGEPDRLRGLLTGVLMNLTVTGLGFLSDAYYRVTGEIPRSLIELAYDELDWDHSELDEMVEMVDKAAKRKPTAPLRAAFVQGQAQIMNNGQFTPVVVIDKALALSLLDDLDRQQHWIDEAKQALSDWHSLGRDAFEELGEPVELLGRHGAHVVRALLASLRRPAS